MQTRLFLTALILIQAGYGITQGFNFEYESPFWAIGAVEIFLLTTHYLALDKKPHEYASSRAGKWSTVNHLFSDGTHERINR